METVRSDIDYINILESAESIAFGTVTTTRRGRATPGRLAALYLSVAIRHRFEDPGTARRYIQRAARKLGLEGQVPRDAFPGNWAVFRVQVERQLLAKGLQLDLFSSLRRDKISPKGAGQLGLF